MKPTTNHALNSDWDLERVLVDLETGDFQERWEAAKQIPQFGEAAIPALVALLQSESQDWELLWFIARILGNLPHPTATEALVNLLQSTQDPEITAIAATALANFGEAALPALGELLTRPATRLIAVQALGQIQHPAVVPLLRSAATASSPEVRVAALEALSQFSDQSVSALLRASLQDPAAEVRRAAVAALSLQVSPEAADRLAVALDPLLSDPNLEVACQTAIALGRIGTATAVAILAAALPVAPPPLQLEIVRALAWTETIPALIHLKRYLLAQSSLPATDPPASLPPASLQTLTQEIIAVLGRVAAAPVRAAAAQILLELLHSHRAQSLQGKQQIAFSLGQLRELCALDPLIDLLAIPDLGVRLHAIAALKQLDSQIAHERLITRLAAETRPELRQGIQLALQEW